ncbi:MAG: ATP-binding protein, partial [Betaproteobacteria bacterium]
DRLMQALLDRSFPADTAVLAEVRGAVRDACRQAGASEECAEAVVLAANEACMNILQHGYGFAAGQTFCVRLHVHDGALVVRFLDHGRPVSASDLRPRELDDLRPGGLGVHFMREVMDRVECLPPPEGFTNLLQLTKRMD